jgi:hypothetical protein
MRAHLLPLLLSAFAAADLQHSLDSQLTGDDFEFEATYPSGLKLSTSDDDAKRGVLPYEEVTRLTPDIVVKGLDEEARKKKYIAFVIMSSIPSIDMMDDVIWGCPWTGVNLTIDANGTLDWGDEYSGGRSQDVDYAEVRNGTMHLWEHTADVDEVLNEKLSDGYGMPNWYHILRIWGNYTDVEPFKVANIDFKFRNEKGAKRCDVSETGAPIEGVEVGDDESCEETPAPEEMSSGDGDGGENGSDGEGEGQDGGDETDAGLRVGVSWSLVGVALCCALAVSNF